MHQISTLNRSQWEGARNHNHGNMLAVCTSDAVDRAQSSDTVRHTHRTDAVNSCIRISRVGRIELIAVSNPRRFTAVFQLLHEFEVIVAGNTKDVPHASFLQAAKQKISNRLFHNACLLQVLFELSGCVTGEDEVMISRLAHGVRSRFVSFSALPWP